MTVTNVTPPTITGTAQQGQLLTASPGTWTSDDPLTYAYQWERCDAGGASCVDITGAVSTSYVPVLADVGGTLRVEVTATEHAPGSALSPPQNLASLQAGASPGSTIQLGAGSYGNQTLTGTNPVTFLLLDGAVLGNLTFNPGSANITVQAQNPLQASAGRIFVGLGTGSPATDIVVQDLDAVRFEINNCLRFRSYDCDYGPCVNERPVISMYSTSARPVDVLIQGGWIHGMQASPPDNPNFHADGILMYAGNGICIRGVTFGRTPGNVVDSNGGTGDLGIFYRTDPNFANVLIQGNASYSAPWSAPGDASYNVQYDGKIYNITFQSNTFPKGMLNTGPGSNPPVSPPPNWPPA